MSKERELLEKVVEYMWVGDIVEEIKELLAQPEPFIFKDRALTGSLIAHDDMYKKGYARAELDLKRESIEDGELEVWYSQHTWAMDKQEYMWGFRDAEKAHGITGVDDE